MPLQSNPFTVSNSRYAVIGLEPVAGSSERLHVGALVEYEGNVVAKTLIRGEVLRCMYGTAGDGLAQMIETTVNILGKIGIEHGWDAAISSIPLANFSLSEPRSSYASSESDLLRQIVLMHFSLSVLADEGGNSPEEQPTPEREVNLQWTTRIRNAVQVARPDLSLYFNREATLVDGGVPVRFGFLSPRLAAHFGLIRPTGQAQGMKDARAKMWELSLARERNQSLCAALVFGVPQLEDVTLSDRQRSQIEANTGELHQEAQQRQVTLRTVQTVNDAVAAVLELA